jgi:hypothetical protein
MTDIPKCDFCSSLKPTRTYDAGGEITASAFVESGPQIGQTQLFTRLWAACEECGAYLDREDIDGLKQRVLNDAHFVFPRDPEFIKMYSDALGVLYDELKRHKLVRV